MEEINEIKNTSEDIFQDLDLNFFQKVAIQALNFTEPTDIQKECLKAFRSNMEKLDNFIITSKAGSGKTFSYILCLLNLLDRSVKKLQAIILLPTRELAHQTILYFEKINSVLPDEEKIIHQLTIGGEDCSSLKPDLQVIVGTLGKTMQLIKKTKAKQKNLYMNLRMIILDEADKLLFQNKNQTFEKFLSECLKTTNGSKKVKFVLVTASFDSNSSLFYSKFAKKFYLIKSEGPYNETEAKQVQRTKNVIHSSDTFVNPLNSNLSEYYMLFELKTKQTILEQKYEMLFEILDLLKSDFKQVLIFYNQKGRGEELAFDLREYGWKTSFIHGDLEPKERIEIYNKIRNLKVRVIITTDLLSRGIDLNTVDFVINFDAPFNSTDYFHRVGRTGRYKALGASISFFQNESDSSILEEIKEKDTSGKIVQITKDNFITLKEEFRRIDQLNKNKALLDEEIRKKIDLLVNEERDALTKSANTCALEKEIVTKKRRRIKYKEESKLNEWVDVDTNLYDNSRFKYFEEPPKEEQANVFSEKKENPQTPKTTVQIPVSSTDQIKANACQNKKFCLYCDFIAKLNK